MPSSVHAPQGRARPRTSRHVARGETPPCSGCMSRKATCKPPSGVPDSRPRTGSQEHGRTSCGQPLPLEFQIPAGELGTCLGAADTSDYRMMSRRLNDGIYVKKLRPNTCAGPLKVEYDYMGRTAASNKHTTQEGTVVYGSLLLGAKNPKNYKEMSDRVQDGIYVKMFGLLPTHDVHLVPSASWCRHADIFCINSEAWQAQISQAKEEFAREQQEGKRQNQKPEFIPTGSMLMLGSAVTDDYSQMSRRVQDGICVKKIRGDDDRKVPAYLLPYREEKLPIRYRAKQDNVLEEDSGSAEQQRPPTNQGASPSTRANTSASNRSKAHTPGSSRRVPEIPQIASLSCMGGMGLEDTSNYAAMCRRRPEKGLPGYPISLHQLGVFDTLPEHERRRLLSTVENGGNETTRGNGVNLSTPRLSAEGESVSPSTPRDELRPRTSAVTSRREKEQSTQDVRTSSPGAAQRHSKAERPLTARETKRPWTASVWQR